MNQRLRRSLLIIAILLIAYLIGFAVKVLGQPT